MEDKKWMLIVFNDVEDYEANSMSFISIKHDTKESLLKDISRMIDIGKPISICEDLL